MQKIIVVMLGILALTACTPRPTEQQVIAQPTPTQTDANADTEKDKNPVMGQTIYVPIYSHIYGRDKSRVINLSATLSIRNTDATNSIRITSARYYGTDGKLLREYVTQPFRLAPMASTDFVVAEDDTTGGVGANFIVEWNASVNVTEPVVEAVMISTASQQGISFVSAGRVIKNLAPQKSDK